MGDLQHATRLLLLAAAVALLATELLASELPPASACGV
eukprot:SAG31_NODE_38476_length_296_cov_0.446701_1_plen_37_part_01